MIIAVIIPAWNDSVRLAQCLRSLEAQTFRDFDVTVVDDGSAAPLRGAFEISNFKFQIQWIRQEHAGAPAARNHGAVVTTSEFLLFLDADAELKPYALERMIAALRTHPEASYAYCAFRFGWKKFRSFPFDAARLRRMPYIHTSSLIRRAHFPGFDPSLTRFQDWDLWLTMLERGYTGVRIREVLYTIQNTKGTMSRWLPSFFHRIPWERIGWMPERVRSYRAALARIREKHKFFG